MSRDDLELVGFWFLFVGVWVAVGVAFVVHETADRLAAITAPRLVLAGGLDRPATARSGQELADGIPGAQVPALAEEDPPTLRRGS